jgi:hypothetical protein
MSEIFTLFAQLQAYTIKLWKTLKTDCVFGGLQCKIGRRLWAIIAGNTKVLLYFFFSLFALT